MRIARVIRLSEDQRAQPEAYALGRRVEQRIVERAKVILMATAGKENLAIAAQLGLSRHTVARWRERFAEQGTVGIEKDAPRPGRTPRVDAEEAVRRTTQEKPANATHWSTRSMAKAVGVSEASVRRIWRWHGLKPHLSGTFRSTTIRSSPMEVSLKETDG